MLFVICNLQAQFPINFDYGISNLIKLDSVSQDNIWQIGQPQKTIFDSAFSLPNAIVTDSINTYPTNNTSVFYCYYTWHLQQYHWPEIMFKYKIDADTLLDFGYIEASYDNGETWIDVMKDADLYDFEWFVTGPDYEEITNSYSDTLPFTGKSNSWYTFYMCMFGWDHYFPYNDTIVYKISFFSDDNETNREGWIIDDIYLSDIYSDVRENSYRNNIVNIFPNPASNSIKLVQSPKVKINEIEVYNQSLQKILNIKAPENTIDISMLKPGLYFAKIKTNEGSAMKKIIVQ